MKIAEVGNVEISQNTVNMKSRMHEEAPQTQEQDPKEALTNPMETVGRSQVNFNGAKKAIKQLTAEELNMIAKMAAELKLDGHEIKVAKQALVDTMNQYKCKSLKQFVKPINESLHRSAENSKFYLTVAEDMLNAFSENVLKIDAKANADRITCILDDLIMR